jgi:hypothetical protein
MSTRAYSKPHPDSVHNRNDYPIGFDPGQLMVSPEQMNRGVTPEFSIQRLECEDLVSDDGEVTKREPLEMEVVRLRVAGDTCSEAVLPVTDQIKSRFATEYAAWKNDAEAIAIAARRATSLKSWNEMPDQLADDLHRKHIDTVQHLAYLPDSAVASIPFGRMWRDKALAYLAAANEDARLTELKDENAALRASMDKMSAEMDKTHKLVQSLIGMSPSNGAKASQ